jgi:hypothetical protein
MILLNISRVYLFNIRNNFIFNKKSYSINHSIKNNILNDKNMPLLYTNQNKLNNTLYSIEHIYPISYFKFKNNNIIINDMHNLIKTTKFINNARSNYKYSDFKEIIYIDNYNFNIIYNNISNNNWKLLDNYNYVNHKKKLFIPNNNSKGFISRAILYISFNYDFDYTKIINTDTLIKWNNRYPPNRNEKYHNYIVNKIQKTDNIFISKYRKINLIKILNGI